MMTSITKHSQNICVSSGSIDENLIISFRQLLTYQLNVDSAPAARTASYPLSVWLDSLRAVRTKQLRDNFKFHMI